MSWRLTVSSWSTRRLLLRLAAGSLAGYLSVVTVRFSVLKAYEREMRARGMWI